MTVKSLTFAALAVAAAATAERFGVTKHTGEKKQLIKNELPKLQNLPSAFDWGNVDGVNYLTNIRQQHNPQYCGSCWAHAVTSVLSDRIKILRKAAWPDINLSPQLLISCQQIDSLGCHGGEPLQTYQWISENYITDETCSIYQGRGWTNGIECSAMSFCRDCKAGQACFVPDEYYIYKVEEYGLVSGEEAMMNEIYQRGPISCSIADPSDLKTYTYGIYYDTTGRLEEDHAVSVVGWGEENGVKFWRVRNSWGTHWGEDGFFRVVRGINNINIEGDCQFGVPSDTWTDAVKHVTTEAEKNDPKNDQTVYEWPQPEYIPTAANQDFLNESKGCRVSKAKFTNGPIHKAERSWNSLPVDILPKNVDWRNMNGRNYMSWNKNQHIPRYCGSCWAQGTTSALADRFNILNNLDSATPVGLNAQAIINCQAGGSCDGGDPALVYEYAYNHGIPDSSCEQYIALNLVDRACTDYDLCKDCVPPPPEEGDDGLANCGAVPHKKYYVSEYYYIKGADQMKSDLAQYGPISCGIQATTEFGEYRGGIYSQHLDSIEINHEISVIGYGVTDEGQEYWIGRNSWGTYWGEYGFFRVQMYSDNLGIENDCTAGIPSYSQNVDTTNPYTNTTSAFIQ